MGARPLFLPGWEHWPEPEATRPALCLSRALRPPHFLMPSACVGLGVLALVALSPFPTPCPTNSKFVFASGLGTGHSQGRHTACGHLFTSVLVSNRQWGLSGARVPLEAGRLPEPVALRLPSGTVTVNARDQTPRRSNPRTCFQSFLSDCVFARKTVKPEIHVEPGMRVCPSCLRGGRTGCGARGPVRACLCAPVCAHLSLCAWCAAAWG